MLSKRKNRGDCFESCGIFELLATKQTLFCVRTKRAGIPGYLCRIEAKITELVFRYHNDRSRFKPCSLSIVLTQNLFNAPG